MLKNATYYQLNLKHSAYTPVHFNALLRKK